jgi:hypothetical protein
MAFRRSDTVAAWSPPRHPWDAGNYITKLPKAEHETQEWQAAMEALILVATFGRPDDGADRRHAGVEPSRRARV